MRNPSSPLTRLLVGSAFVGLLLRVLIPPGMMPAPLEDGWPVQLCPSQMGIFAPLPGHDAHAGHHGTHASHEEEQQTAAHCPLGVLLAFALHLDEPESAAVELAPIGRVLPPSSPLIATRTTIRTAARGPPA